MEDLITRFGRAVQVVQQDLDATGRGELRLCPVVERLPALAFFVGVEGRGISNSHLRWCDDELSDPELVEVAAEKTSETLMLALSWLLFWPVCSRHGGGPLDGDVVGGIARWVCRRGHEVADIGALTADLIAMPTPPSEPPGAPPTG